ncbi:unnamed protein product, partial [Ranitomeya imitator]
CSPTSKNSPLSDAGRVSPDGGTLAPAVALSWCWPPAQEDEDGRPAASAVARGCILVWCRASPGEGGAPASVVSMVRCWLVDRGGGKRSGVLSDDENIGSDLIGTPLPFSRTLCPTPPDSLVLLPPPPPDSFVLLPPPPPDSFVLLPPPPPDSFVLLPPPPPDSFVLLPPPPPDSLVLLPPPPPDSFVLFPPPSPDSFVLFPPPSPDSFVLFPPPDSFVLFPPPSPDFFVLPGPQTKGDP